jgi:hypothetical protein
LGYRVTCRIVVLRFMETQGSGFRIQGSKVNTFRVPGFRGPRVRGSKTESNPSTGTVNLDYLNSLTIILLNPSLRG